MKKQKKKLGYQPKTEKTYHKFNGISCTYTVMEVDNEKVIFMQDKFKVSNSSTLTFIPNPICFILSLVSS
jgi:hypothetical protein